MSIKVQGNGGSGCRTAENKSAPPAGSGEGVKARHILISGSRGAGKTALIDRIIRETSLPVYGYRTAVAKTDDDGTKHIHIYPAGRRGGSASEENRVGCSREKVLSVNNEVFNGLGSALLKEARPGSLIVMDEIGFMEMDAEEFRRAVNACFDGDIHILAAIKDAAHTQPCLEELRNHPAAELITITEENRSQVYEYVRERVRGWESGE